MSIFEHSSALGYGIFEKYIFLWNPCTFNSIELKDNSANGSVTFNIYIYIYISFFEKNKIFTTVDFLCCVFVKNNFNWSLL